MTRLIIVVGPTGVGKSAFAEQLAYEQGGVIVNGDMGQLYRPLSIGTAKPDLSLVRVPHLLFDVISEPRDYTAYEYRALVQQFLSSYTGSGPVIIVGGSLFYIQSLLFRGALAPRADERAAVAACADQARFERWQELAAVAPAHAAQIHYRDRYRVARAFSLLPERSPLVYDPVSPVYELIHLSRERRELYERIDLRVLAMFAQGWLAEVEQLSAAWHQWLTVKKLIGYNELVQAIGACAAGEVQMERSELIRLIQQRTRHYAKRQLTFWRMLRRRIEQLAPGRLCEVSLCNS